MKANKRIFFAFVVVVLTFTFVSSKDKMPMNITQEDLASLDELLKAAKEGNSTNLEDFDTVEEQIKEVMEEFGLTENSNVDRETFTKFFTKILMQDDVVHGEEKVMFDKLIERVVGDAPENFPASDLPKYIDMEKITRLLNEIMMESGINPQEAMNEFKNFAQDMTGEIPTSRTEAKAEEDGQESDEEGEDTEEDGEGEGEDTEDSTDDDEDDDEEVKKDL